MLSKKIKFEDLEGNMREQEFLFHLTTAEITKLQLEEEGGFMNKLKDLLNRQDVPGISKVVDRLIMLSVGERSSNGISFIKNDEIRTNFRCSDAYSALYMELMASEEAIADFLRKIIPRDVAAKIAEAEKNGDLEKAKDAMMG